MVKEKQEDWHTQNQILVAWKESTWMQSQGTKKFVHQLSQTVATTVIPAQAEPAVRVQVRENISM